jgi:hypothetical protein
MSDPIDSAAAWQKEAERRGRENQSLRQEVDTLLDELRTAKRSIEKY